MSSVFLYFKAIFDVQQSNCSEPTWIDINQIFIIINEYILIYSCVRAEIESLVPSWYLQQMALLVTFVWSTAIAEVNKQMRRLTAKW
jgi:hypothetical protein